MSATTLDDRSSTAPPSAGKGPRGESSVSRSWLKEPIWHRFTPLQLLVMTLATIAPLIVAVVITAGLFGVISEETMMTIALAAGEDPGMIIFGAMFLATPVQQFTGRTQVRVRKYLGIVFFLLALSNGAMFVVESGFTATVGEPFLIAGVIALALSAPLFLTSSRWSQQVLGMRRWRLLHKATYVIAAALIVHLVLIPEIALGLILIVAGFILRIPAIRVLLSGKNGKQPG